MQAKSGDSTGHSPLLAEYGVPTLHWSRAGTRPSVRIATALMRLRSIWSFSTQHITRLAGDTWPN